MIGLIEIRNAEDILSYFENWDLGGGEIYLRYHSPRYAHLSTEVKKIFGARRYVTLSGDKAAKILDVGPWFQTEVFRKTLPGIIVNTLGFENPKFKPRPSEEHFHFDLNDVRGMGEGSGVGEHDLVVMAEVLEHLRASPKEVLNCAATWVKSGGYLILQTPNAVNLYKRLRMVGGKHPHKLACDPDDEVGHLREYTLEELIALGREAGLVLAHYDIRNYFRRQGLAAHIYNAVCKILPKAFRDGITICFKKV